MAPGRERYFRDAASPFDVKKAGWHNQPAFLLI